MQISQNTRGIMVKNYTQLGTGRIYYQSQLQFVLTDKNLFV